MNIAVVRRLWAALTRVNWKVTAKTLSPATVAAISGYFAGVGGRAKEANEDAGDYVAQQVKAMTTPQEMYGFVVTLAKSMTKPQLDELRLKLASDDGINADVLSMLDDVIGKSARYATTGDQKVSPISLDDVTRIRHATKRLYAASRALNVSLETFVQIRAALLMDEDLIDAVLANEEAILRERGRI